MTGLSVFERKGDETFPTPVLFELSSGGGITLSSVGQGQEDRFAFGEGLEIEDPSGVYCLNELPPGVEDFRDGLKGALSSSSFLLPACSNIATRFFTDMDVIALVQVSGWEHRSPDKLFYCSVSSARMAFLLLFVVVLTALVDGLRHCNSPFVKLFLR